MEDDNRIQFVAHVMFFSGVWLWNLCHKILLCYLNIYLLCIESGCCFEASVKRQTSWLFLSVLQVYTRWHARKAKSVHSWATWFGYSQHLCLLCEIFMLLLSNAGWSALLPAQIKGFWLILLRTHCTPRRSKSRDKTIKKTIRNLNQTRAGRKASQRDTDPTHTNLAFGPEEGWALLLLGTTGTGTSTQRTSMNSDQANEEEPVPFQEWN